MTDIASRLCAAMRLESLDALVISSPENFAYVEFLVLSRSLRTTCPSSSRSNS
jgi:hypothetical protein